MNINTQNVKPKHFPDYGDLFYYPLISTKDVYMRINDDRGELKCVCLQRECDDSATFSYVRGFVMNGLVVLEQVSPCEMREKR